MTDRSHHYGQAQAKRDLMFSAAVTLLFSVFCDVTVRVMPTAG